MPWLESWSNTSVLAIGRVVFTEIVKHVVIKNAFVVTDRCVMFTKSQAHLHANPCMCVSSGDYCNLLCCKESNHSGVNSCELISTGAKEPSEPEVCGLPQHLRSLYERSVAHLDDQQAVVVYQLLNEFADTFSKGAGNLGRTDLVKCDPP